MVDFRITRPASRVFICLAMGLIVLATSHDAFGQGMRRRGGAKGGGAGGPRNPVATTEKPLPQTPGSQSGQIVKYKPASEKDAEKGITGYLTIRPFEKGAKLLKLAVFRNDDEEKNVVVRLGDHRFEVEDYGEVFWKGLYCTAGWGYKDNDESSRIKELRVLTFDPIEVKGKVDRIEDDSIIIRVLPKNGQEWPHLVAKAKPTNPNAAAKPVKIRQLKVTLKTVDDVSKVLDSDNEETSLSSFEPGQAIEASIVYSNKLGMIVRLSPPGDGTIRPAEPEAPPPPRPTEPRGGGGRRRGPVGGG